MDAEKNDYNAGLGGAPGGQWTCENSVRVEGAGRCRNGLEMGDCDRRGRYVAEHWSAAT